MRAMAVAGQEISTVAFYSEDVPIIRSGLGNAAAPHLIEGAVPRKLHRGGKSKHDGDVNYLHHV
jgi:hypothetical protein